MKSFDLITADEKQLVADGKEKKFSELILLEWDDSKKDLSERGKQLREFRELYREGAKLTRIRLKVEALNRYREVQEQLTERLVDPALIGKKVLRRGGSIMKEYWPLFKEDSTGRISLDDNKHYIISHHVVKASRFLHVVVSVTVWQHGESATHRQNFIIYGLEKDEQTIKDVCKPSIPAQVNFMEELEAAEKYLRYKAKAEEKMQELRRDCNFHILSEIENVGIFHGKF